MSIKNLDKFFRPQRIAVIGASDHPGKVGYTLFRNLTTASYQGIVYPVNATRASVQGVAAYRGLADLPHRPDLAVICTPAKSVPELVVQCGTLGIPAVLVISAGFHEAGPEGGRLEEQLRQTLMQFPGLRMIGPNCLGMMVPEIGLNATFASDIALPGRVAFISQSGAVCTSILDWSRASGLGFSYFLSTGNMLDVGLADLLDYLALDPHTDAVVMYVEAITQARAFMSAARAFSREKPIVAYKAGRFSDSAKAAASHTGAMAGVDAVYEAAFRRAGIVRVFDIDEIFDCAQLLATERTPRGPRLAIVTNAGGPGVMASDTLIARRGVLATLSPDIIDNLDRLLPPFWSHGNPIDILGDAPAERYGDVLRILVNEPNLDGTIVLLAPQAMTDPAAAAEAVINACRHRTKPVLTSWMGAERVRDGVALLHSAGIPTYLTAERAVNAFMGLVEFARNQEVLAETPQVIPVQFQVDVPSVRKRLEAAITRRETVLSEDDSKQLLADYGLDVVIPIPAHSAEEAVTIAEQLGFPVVLKICSPQITHKTDVGGVVLNLIDPADVRTAYATIVESAARARPDAEILGVTVQRMVTAVHGVELIVGMKRDPVFGPVIMVGLGGVTAELFQDRALELPPLNERLARRMLQSLRAWPLLTGYRGRPVVDVDRLIETLIRFSYLVAQLPEISEIDMNPLLVTPTHAVALDARVILSEEGSGSTPIPYSHLAIRPYPDEWVQTVSLRNGAQLTLRPIRPEDEPLWKEMVSNCSIETLHRRFRGMFKAPTHTMAVRFCFIDYDREMAIVAEYRDQGKVQLVGVGRLITNPERNCAEYAVLVVDTWQGRGLGSLLTDTCLGICSQWGIDRVVAETAPDNFRTLRMFENRGFVLDRTTCEDTVQVSLSRPHQVSHRGTNG